MARQRQPRTERRCPPPPDPRRRPPPLLRPMSFWTSGVSEPDRRWMSSKRPTLAGSPIRSITAMRPSTTVNPTTYRGRPAARTMAPGSAVDGRGLGERREWRARPRGSRGRHRRRPAIGGRASRPAPPPSIRKTTFGSSTRSRASKSPARAAARNASTTRRWTARSASGLGAPSRTLRRARLASWRAAAGVLPDDVGDLVERDREHVVEHERQAPSHSATAPDVLLDVGRFVIQGPSGHIRSAVRGS